MDGMLDALISKLEKLEYKSSYSGSTYMHSVISKDNLGLVKAVVTEWYDMYFGNEYGRKIGELEAKVYAYEQIIANSNFAPMIKYKTGDGNVAQRD